MKDIFRQSLLAFIIALLFLGLRKVGSIELVVICALAIIITNQFENAK